MYNSKQHYRRSIRLKEYDYSFPNWYYVTLCTKYFKCWFGKIKKSKVIYNELGRRAVRYFNEIPKHFKNTELDYFVVMPNHVHGIIIMGDVVGTLDRVSLQEGEFGKMVKNSLSLMVNQYKGSVAGLPDETIFRTLHGSHVFMNI
jgi:REP element-mobilizing transposase RayT